MPTPSRYLTLKAAGKCSQCSSRQAVEGRTMCGRCSEKVADDMEARRDRRRAAGLCPHCGRAPEPGHKTCVPCRRNHKHT